MDKEGWTHYKWAQYSGGTDRNRLKAYNIFQLNVTFENRQVGRAVPTKVYIVGMI